MTPPPFLELFQKFIRFGDATCPFLTDFVPGDFHWYLISLLFFLWGHYECLLATYSDPYLIFSFTIFRHGTKSHVRRGGPQRDWQPPEGPWNI